MKYQTCFLFITLLTSNDLYSAELMPLRFEVTVPMNASQVWSSWTTEEGAQGFFGRKAIIDPRVGGEFSIHFFPDAEPGHRGAENLQILAFEENQRIAFSWDAPPQWPQARSQRTFVDVSIFPVDMAHTRVVLRHMGWGHGAEWAEVQKYFDGAWEVVLARLEYLGQHGPIDWDNPPEGLMYSGE